MDWLGPRPTEAKCRSGPGTRGCQRTSSAAAESLPRVTAGNQSDRIVTLDLDRRVTSWNLAAEELFGYTAEEAIGCDLEDLVANQEDLRVEYSAYFDELKQGQRFRAVTRRSRKDGTLVDVDLARAPQRSGRLQSHAGAMTRREPGRT